MSRNQQLDNNIHQSIFSITDPCIDKPLVFRNLATPILYEEALQHEYGSFISRSGSLVVSSHKYTGRVPKEKRIVRDTVSEDTVQWGDINIPISERAFCINRERAVDYINSRSRVYVVDAFAGWDTKYRIKIRTICTRAYHALFMSNMLIMPSKEELKDFGDPDYTILNAGVFPANRYTEGITSDATVIINLKTKEMVIMGTEYAGEMKKGVFSIMNYLMPFEGVLPMHCAANVDEDGKNTTLFFGLSGTGKTTLSSDENRLLIGDDEHCWTDTGISNIEGGCYAKCIDPPESIKKCITFGALLENLVYDDETRAVDYHDESITANTRASYPLANIPNILMSCIAEAPKNIIFLTCDAYGVLPPVSKLNKKQAMYHFINGYTSKAPNTEAGITEPTATFSACFGEVFLPLNPTVYAELLAKKIDNTDISVWLVNTGWIGGDYHSGRRISLKNTQIIIKNIYNNTIAESSFIEDSVFKFQVCTTCEGIEESLNPREAWESMEQYEQQTKMLAAMFHENIKKYDNSAFIDGGPIVL